MPRLGVSKKKKSPRATELSQLKKEVQRVAAQLESRDRELVTAKVQRPRRVTFSVSSVVLQPICNRCLIRSPSILLSSVVVSSVLSTGLTAS